MDDFIQILIWLFIIISFFSSFFRKKNKQPQDSSSPSRQETAESFPQRTQTAASVDEEEYDILKEIESMFKQNTSQNRFPGEKETNLEKMERSNDETTPTASEHISYERTRREDEIMRTERKSIEVPTIDRSKFDHASYSPSKRSEERTKKRVLREAENAAAERAESFEKFLESRGTEGFSRAREVKSRLRQPSTLKEYILIAEILGKPISLSGRYKSMRR